MDPFSATGTVSEILKQVLGVIVKVLDGSNAH